MIIQSNTKNLYIPYFEIQNKLLCSKQFVDLSNNTEITTTNKRS